MGAQTTSGLVLVDKPAGPSSFAIVADLRRRYGAKAGHAGTLDPLATGLLLVLLGRGTRLARYLVGLDKRYRTEIRLGLRTSTGDGEGEVIEETPIASEAEIAALEGDVELPVLPGTQVVVQWFDNSPPNSSVNADPLLDLLHSAPMASMWSTASMSARAR